MTERLKGKVALITGAAQGLGQAMAVRFVAEGAFVIMTDINADGVAAAAAQLGNQAQALGHDVTSAEDWARAVAAAKAHHDGLHILVNNAGIAIGGDIERLTYDDWVKTHRVDVDSIFLGCQAALPLMAASCAGGQGSILNISSIAAMIASDMMPAYNSAKAAVRHLTKSIALHCARRGYRINCNSIHPVFIDTPIIDGMGFKAPREETIAKLARQVPLGRIGQPEDVAAAAVYLCSDEAAFVTGAELAIDGGISAM